MLVQSQLPDASTQETEVLIGAKFLTQIEGIEVEPVGTDVTYFHMLFECHQVVEAEGAVRIFVYRPRGAQIALCGGADGNCGVVPRTIPA